MMQKKWSNTQYPVNWNQRFVVIAQIKKIVGNMNKSKAITYLHATKWDEFQLIVANRIMPHASNMPHVEVHVFSISLITSAVPFILDAITSSYYSKESMMLNIILFVPKGLKNLIGGYRLG